MTAYLKAKPWAGQPGVRYLHAKRDGHRLFIVREHENDPPRVLTTRPVDITEQLAGWCQWYERARWIPAGSVIEGELWRPGEPASYVKTGIKQQDQHLRLDVFAVPRWRYQEQHSQTLSWAEARANELSLAFAPWAHWLGDYLTDLRALMRFVGWEPSETEGVVLKKANYHGWYKLKMTRTVDLVVTGFVDGEGKYLGNTGALRCSVVLPNSKTLEVACVSGMDDDTRALIDEQADLGRVVEVEYQYVGSGGRLRHPRFKRWRDDKNATSEDCGPEQDPAWKDMKWP